MNIRTAWILERRTALLKQKPNKEPVWNNVFLTDEIKLKL